MQRMNQKYHARPTGMSLAPPPYDDGYPQYPPPPYSADTLQQQQQHHHHHQHHHSGVGGGSHYQSSHVPHALAMTNHYGVPAGMNVHNGHNRTLQRTISGRPSQPPPAPPPPG